MASRFDAAVEPRVEGPQDSGEAYVLEDHRQLRDTVREHLAALSEAHLHGLMAFPSSVAIDLIFRLSP